MPSQGLTTGRLARESGVTPEAIRYYERRKLLSRPPRSAAGYRRYPEDSVRRVRFIKEAQQLGFTLEEIAELLALRTDARMTCADVKAFADAKVAEIGARIAALESMRQALLSISSACDAKGPLSACPILDSLDGKKGAR